MTAGLASSPYAIRESLRDISLMLSRSQLQRYYLTRFRPLEPSSGPVCPLVAVRPESSSSYWEALVLLLPSIGEVTTATAISPS